MRDLLVGGPLPEDPPRPAVEAHHKELVAVLRTRRQVAPRRLGDQRRKLIDGPVRLERCGNEDPVTPDNRRRVAFTGDLDLPLDVCPFVPTDGRIPVRGHPAGPRPSPLMPVERPGRGKIVGLHVAGSQTGGERHHHKSLHRS